MKQKNGKHDSGVDEVVRQLHRDCQPFDSIDTLVKYDKGEMDLVARRGSYVMIVEFKSTDRYYNRKKAYQQLDRAASQYKGCEVDLVYAYWDNDKIVMETLP